MNGHLKKIIHKYKTKWYLEDVNIPEVTIQMRSVRHEPFVHINHDGVQYPLLEINNTLVKLIHMVAQICQCLTPSVGSALLNHCSYDLISVSESRSTLISLTSLYDVPVICILIIQWKAEDLPDETGICVKGTLEG